MSARRTKTTADKPKGSKKNIQTRCRKYAENPIPTTKHPNTLNKPAETEPIPS